MLHGTQGKSKFGTPLFKPDFIRKHIYCIEESTCDIVGTFQCLSQSFGTLIRIRCPGNCAPFASPLLRLRFTDVCHVTLMHNRCVLDCTMLVSNVLFLNLDITLKSLDLPKLGKICLNITRQALEEESCSNPLKM